jgi:hypothetical protein
MRYITDRIRTLHKCHQARLATMPCVVRLPVAMLLEIFRRRCIINQPLVLSDRKISRLSHGHICRGRLPPNHRILSPAHSISNIFGELSKRCLILKRRHRENIRPAKVMMSTACVHDMQGTVSKIVCAALNCSTETLNRP